MWCCFTPCADASIERHKVFQGLAQRGKSSTGWFYGFNLHAVINHQGDLLALKVTPGNVDDRKVLLSIASNLFGKLFADKGYTGKDFARKMKDKCIEVVTRVRKNMPVCNKTRRRWISDQVWDDSRSGCFVLTKPFAD